MHREIEMNRERNRLDGSTRGMSNLDGVRRGEERREEEREMKEGQRGIDKEDGEGKKKREGYGEIEMSR